MLVQFRCQECGERVTNEMNFCVKCGTVLPAYNFTGIYSEDYDERYEPAVETEVSWREEYTESLLDTFVGNVPSEAERVEVEGPSVKAEHGEKAYKKWVLLQYVPLLLVALGYLFVWVPLIFWFVPEPVNTESWLRFAIALIFPFYFITLGLFVRNDKRQVSLTDKLIMWALPAFNHLFLQLFYLSIIGLIIWLVNTFFWPFLFKM